MHEIAKRGMAFAVTTGSLLLAGAGYASAAEQATGVPAAHGLEQSASHVTRALAAPAEERAVDRAHLRSPQLRDAPGGARAGVASGNDVTVPVDAGVNACGNDINILGIAGPGAQCAINAQASAASVGSAASGASGASAASAGGVLSDNRFDVPIKLPINLCGITGLIAGVATGHTHCAVNTSARATSSASSEASASSDTTASDEMSSSAEGTADAQAQAQGGVLSDNKIDLSLSAPMNACGTTATVAGVQGATAECRIDLPGNAASSASVQMPQSTDSSSIALDRPGAVAVDEDTQEANPAPAAAIPATNISSTATSSISIPGTAIPDATVSDTSVPDTAIPAIDVPPAAVPVTVDAAAPAPLTADVIPPAVHAEAPIPAAQAPAAPYTVVAHPFVVWPRPDTARRPAHHKPLACSTPEIGLTADTKTLSSEGGALSSIAIAGAAFASGTGLTALAHRRRR